MTSPLFWSALALLVLNDHVLKRAHLLPGVVTGKLSDLAGLVVAPVLLVTLVRARTTAARAAGFAAVAGLFAAIKVVPAAATTLVAVLSWVGITWRVVCDPTDLVALVVLPLAWRLVANAEPVARGGLARAGMLVGLAACLASGRPPPTWTTDAYVVNRTGRDVDLRLRFFDGQIDCDRIGDAGQRALAATAFGSGITFQLAAGDTLPISEEQAHIAAGIESDPTAPVQPHDGRCGAVLLQADGMPDALAWWSDIEPRAIPLSTKDDTLDTDPALRAGAVDIELADDRPHARSAGMVQVGSPLFAAEPSSCPTAGPSIQWSEIDAYGQPFRIAAIEELPDGCLDVGLDPPDAPDDATPAQHMSLCAPPDVFPFQAGDEVLIDMPAASTGRALRFRKSRSSLEVTLLAGQMRLEAIDPAATLAPIACPGDRVACGGYTIPAALEIGGSRIEPGGEAVLGGMRVLLGRSEVVVTGREACEPGRDELGTRADLVVIRGEGG